ncbi:MarR family winged helix-turn-helix transcriptional regulator [Paenibacillus sp. GXUN7292]|uniref:MarR family winged helix-turn-helix transcriptional regulator n=1 Tax=Paenibacillus sp. GXUN7292 TaxID=3422499 RepID=UPI003D7E8F0A
MTRQHILTEFEELYIDFQRKIGAAWQKKMEHTISSSQGTILFRLNAAGPQKFSALAEKLGITPGAVTSLSDKLISAGYAERKRDEEDRRVVYLEITEAGSEIVKSLKMDIKGVVKSFFEGVSDEDLKHLTRIYEQILKNINEIEKG